MIQLSDYEFSNYLFDPTITDARLERAMSKYKEFTNELPKLMKRGKVLKYIVLMYDINTEMNNVFPDLNTRKRECAILAGFIINDDSKFDSDVEDFLIGKNEVINDMIIRYTRLFNNPDYMAYISYCSMLSHEILASLTTTKLNRDSVIVNKDSADYRYTLNNIDALTKKINDLSKSIFCSDNSTALRKALYKSMEREKLALRPESIADMNDKGEVKLKVDPYKLG